MWPFKKKSDCKCSNPCAPKSTCKVISVDDLRTIANMAQKQRITTALDSIRYTLQHHAEHHGITPTSITFNKDLEATILNELANCGIIVDLDSKTEYTQEQLNKARDTYSNASLEEKSEYHYAYMAIRENINKVTYKVSF